MPCVCLSLARPALQFCQPRPFGLGGFSDHTGHVHRSSHKSQRFSLATTSAHMLWTAAKTIHSLYFCSLVLVFFVLYGGKQQEALSVFLFSGCQPFFCLAVFVHHILSCLSTSNSTNPHAHSRRIHIHIEFMAFPGPVLVHFSCVRVCLQIFYVFFFFSPHSDQSP